MASSHKLKSKILVLHREYNDGKFARELAEEYGVTRQAIQWLLHHYPDVNWTVLNHLDKLQADEYITGKYQTELNEIKEFLENLP